MITPTEQDSPQLRIRYRPLAGPFYAPQAELCKALLEGLIQSRARVIAAYERGGVTLFRLRSECETREQTARRFKKLSRR
jgi:hypothetical protein